MSTNQWIWSNRRNDLQQFSYGHGCKGAGVERNDGTQTKAVGFRLLRELAAHGLEGLLQNAFLCLSLVLACDHFGEQRHQLGIAPAAA